MLCQNAYRDGSLGAALSTMTVIDPLTAIALGAALLDETLHTGLLGATTATGAAALIATGICILAPSPTRHPIPTPAAAVAARAPSTHAERATDRPLTRTG